jgi:hypothetical protein
MREFTAEHVGPYMADKRMGGRSFFVFLFGYGVGILRHWGPWRYRFHIFRIVKEN